MIIEKEPGNPKIHRLRVIHMCEADHNLLLSVKHRDLVHHMNDHTKFKEGIHSNRPGFSATDPVFVEELQNEFGRLTRHKQTKMDADADFCHDKIVPNIGMPTLQKYGMPPKVCAVQGKTLAEMRCNLMTGLGPSELDYQHCHTFPIHGTGQGSAASPVIWITIVNNLIECHEQLGHGASHASPDDKSHLEFNAVGFVDDCSCQVTGNPMTPDRTLLTKTQSDAQLWRDLLNVTGGELSEKNAHVILPNVASTPADSRS